MHVRRGLLRIDHGDRLRRDLRAAVGRLATDRLAEARVERDALDVGQQRRGRQRLVHRDHRRRVVRDGLRGLVAARRRLRRLRGRVAGGGRRRGRGRRGAAERVRLTVDVDLEPARGEREHEYFLTHDEPPGERWRDDGRCDERRRRRRSRRRWRRCRRSRRSAGGRARRTAGASRTRRSRTRRCRGTRQRAHLRLRRPVLEQHHAGVDRQADRAEQRDHAGVAEQRVLAGRPLEVAPHRRVARAREALLHAGQADAVVALAEPAERGDADQHRGRADEQHDRGGAGAHVDRRGDRRLRERRDGRGRDPRSGWGERRPLEAVRILGAGLHGARHQQPACRRKCLDPRRGSAGAPGAP